MNVLAKIGTAFLTCIEWAMDRIGAAWDSQDHTLELREMAFAAVVVAAIIWLDQALATTGKIDGNWVSAFGILAGLVTLKDVCLGHGGPRKDGEQ
jgi:hypothetical protein